MSSSVDERDGTPPVVEIRDLQKSYGAVKAVRGISFTVPKGSVLGFLGPNGAGKTTVLKILTGYLAADAGTAKVSGFDIETNPIEAKRRIGYLPENNPLYLEQRVSDFLSFAYRARGLPRAKKRDAIDRAVTETGLEEVYRRPIGQCSKGYRQRVGLAQALLHDPPLLILDEPTNGLDPNQVVEIRQLIRLLGETKTVLLTSHVLPEVQMLAEHLILIAKGSKVADAPLNDLMHGAEERPRVRVQILGDSSQLDSLAEAAQAEVVRVLPGLRSDCAAAEWRVAALPDAALNIYRLAREHELTLVELAPQATNLESVFRSLTGSEETL